MINLRYGYRVHKNIMLGADLTYYNSKCYNSLENIRTCVANYNTVNIGAFSRFIVSKYKVVKPFADIVILYNYSHAKFDTTYSVYSYSAPIDNYHSFNCSITPGISFMIWQNHINFDLGAKFSPFKKNYNGSYFMFTWKIGYNFNAK